MIQGQGCVGSSRQFNCWCRIWYLALVSDTQKITVEVPSDLLARARAASRGNLTEAVRQGLRLVAAGPAYERLRARRGKAPFSRSAATLRLDRG
jgi:hypothetical protein